MPRFHLERRLISLSSLGAPPHRATGGSQGRTSAGDYARNTSTNVGFQAKPGIARAVRASRRWSIAAIVAEKMTRNRKRVNWDAKSKAPGPMGSGGRSSSLLSLPLTARLRDAHRGRRRSGGLTEVGEGIGRRSEHDNESLPTRPARLVRNVLGERAILGAVVDHGGNRLASGEHWQVGLAGRQVFEHSDD